MCMEELLKTIEAADTVQIEDILAAAMRRKRELYPDWEIVYCAARKREVNGPEALFGRCGSSRGTCGLIIGCENWAVYAYTEKPDEPHLS